jgi:MGT family glycosyltransferase
MQQLLDTGADMLPTLIEDVRALNPNAVIYDTMTVWGKQVGQALGLPVIAACSIFPINSRNAKALPRDWAAFGKVLLRVPQLISALRGYRHTERAIKQKFGVASPNIVDFFCNPGDMTILFTSRAFAAGADLFDDSFKFVGVSIAPRNDVSDFPVHLLEGKPVIYVSLGTLFNKQTQFFRDCIAAFGDSSQIVVMSIGRNVRMGDLGDIPSNFIVWPSVPQLDVLQRASAFITHGGMNSTSESLWFGVPMVVVPQMGDQIFIGQRVAQLKAGVLVNHESVSPQTLRVCAEAVLANGDFRANARQLGESLRGAGGYARAADEVIAFVNRQSSNAK